MTFQCASFIEITTLEINLCKEKLLIFDTYKTPNINNGSILNGFYRARTFYNALNKYCVLFDDFNIVRDNTELQNFCNSFLLEGLIKKPTCCKQATDHIITTIANRFMKSMALETGNSGNHRMIMTIFCSTFAKA